MTPEKATPLKDYGDGGTTKGGNPENKNKDTKDGWETISPNKPQKKKENEQDEPHGDDKWKWIVVAVLIVIAACAFLIFGRSLKANSTEIGAESVLELDHDINFSQVEKIDTSAVDVLLKIKNESDSPIKSVNYKILYKDEYYTNRMDDSDIFFAYGQIEPGETGYMYSQIYLQGDTPKKQGKIVIDSAEKGSDLGEYVVPNGQVTEFDKITDSYDVWILNKNDSDVNLRESVVIAVAEDSGSLAGAWGCSTQNDIYMDYIPAGTDVTLKAAIHDPGFDVPITDRTYKAFVIEKEVIGVD